MRSTLLLLLLLSTPAFADEEDEEPEEAPDTEVQIFETAPDTPRNIGNFRTGAGSSSENGHPYLCLEVSPLSFLAFEGCGTGSGFLHNDQAPEIASPRRSHSAIKVATRSESRFSSSARTCSRPQSPP